MKKLIVLLMFLLFPLSSALSLNAEDWETETFWAFRIFELPKSPEDTLEVQNWLCNAMVCILKPQFFRENYGAMDTNIKIEERQANCAKLLNQLYDSLEIKIWPSLDMVTLSLFGWHDIEKLTIHLGLNGSDFVYQVIFAFELSKGRLSVADMIARYGLTFELSADEKFNKTYTYMLSKTDKWKSNRPKGLSGMWSDLTFRFGLKSTEQLPDWTFLRLVSEDGIIIDEIDVVYVKDRKR